MPMPSCNARIPGEIYHDTGITKLDGRGERKATHESYSVTGALAYGGTYENG